jgi:hypothetical protein
MDPRNYMHDDGVLHAWFIFNQHTEISFVFTQTQIFNIFTKYTAILSNPLRNEKGTPTYLEVQLLARGDEFPSTLVPCLVTTTPPLALAPFTPFPPLSPHYTIYKDDINNHGLLCPGHYPH